MKRVLSLTPFAVTVTAPLPPVVGSAKTPAGALSEAKPAEPDGRLPAGDDRRAGRHVPDEDALGDDHLDRRKCDRPGDDHRCRPEYGMGDHLRSAAERTRAQRGVVPGGTRVRLARTIFVPDHERVSSADKGGESS
jgi:hypothetical protein